MQGPLASLILLLVVALVLTRAAALRRRGVKALRFGELDKSDFLVPPFALFYFYLVFAAAFGWPTVSRQVFFRSDAIAWIGVACGLAGLSLFVWALVSFGRSFRVGIDVERPDALVTTGVFAFSRNPIYVAFGAILFGQFLVFPNWILALYLVGAGWLIHRQVRREEGFLEAHYGEAYQAYRQRVRRYL